MSAEYGKALTQEPDNVAKHVTYDELGMHTEHEGMAKKRLQDKENSECIGGLRQPHRGSVSCQATEKQESD